MSHYSLFLDQSPDTRIVLTRKPALGEVDLSVITPLGPVCLTMDERALTQSGLPFIPPSHVSLNLTAFKFIIGLSIANALVLISMWGF